MERLSPLLVLVLSECLMGLAPLFGLAASVDGPLPRLGPCLLALAIWALPDVVRLARFTRSPTAAPRLFRASVHSMRSGLAALALTTGIMGLVRLWWPDLTWAMVGFAAFLVARYCQARRLRWHLEGLSLLES